MIESGLFQNKNRKRKVTFQDTPVVLLDFRTGITLAPKGNPLVQCESTSFLRSDGSCVGIKRYKYLIIDDCS